MRVRWMAMPALLAACGSPPPALPPAVTLPVVSASASAAPEPPAALDPTMVSVNIVAVPAQLTIDGDAREWGSILPEDPPPARPPEPVKGPDPNPRAALSHAAIAVSQDALLVVAELRGPAREGAWLAVGSEAPALPLIGEYQRGGGVRELDCESEPFTGVPLTKEAAAACRAVLDRYARLTAEHEARFARVFRLDREGVRERRADGALTAVAGAKAVWKPGAEGATLEASLPLQAMPRLSYAPLTSLRLWSRAATSAEPPKIVGEQWVPRALPAPLSFEPLGEIRARVFEGIGGRVIYPPSLSYQPGLHSMIESSRYAGQYDRQTVQLDEGRLYTKAASLGDLEVGFVSAYADWLAVWKQGKLVEMLAASASGKVIPRDGGLHILASSEWYNEDSATPGAQWTAMVVGADGAVREDVLQVDNTVPTRWTQVSTFHDKGYASFGLRGASHWPDGAKEQGYEVTWRWSKGDKRYKPSVRRVPVPRRARKR